MGLIDRHITVEKAVLLSRLEEEYQVNYVTKQPYNSNSNNLSMTNAPPTTNNWQGKCLLLQERFHSASLPIWESLECAAVEQHHGGNSPECSWDCQFLFAEPRWLLFSLCNLKCKVVAGFSCCGLSSLEALVDTKLITCLLETGLAWSSPWPKSGWSWWESFHPPFKGLASDPSTNEACPSTELIWRSVCPSRQWSAQLLGGYPCFTNMKREVGSCWAALHIIHFWTDLRSSSPSDSAVGQCGVGPWLWSVRAACSHGRWDSLCSPLFRELNCKTQAVAGLRLLGWAQEENAQLWIAGMTQWGQPPSCHHVFPGISLVLRSCDFVGNSLLGLPAAVQRQQFWAHKEERSRWASSASPGQQLCPLPVSVTHQRSSHERNSFLGRARYRHTQHMPHVFIAASSWHTLVMEIWKQTPLHLFFIPQCACM